jgi:elongation factor Ts
MKKISASQVKELRDLTGASVIECREALIESGGNIEKARECLRRKGKEKAGKKSGRETNEGVVSSYVHSNRKVGAMIELRCETDFVAKNAEFQELAHDLAMHVAAMSPKYVSFSDVPEEDKKAFEESVRKELAGPARNASRLGRDAGGEKKPAEIIEKIVEGKVKKNFEQMCLLDQAFIKNPEMTVSDLVKEKISKIGENIQVGNFVRFEI